MVVGLDGWRDHFADYADRYALIGKRAACAIQAAPRAKRHRLRFMEV